jgi:P4 family phage/plasmid primase-like protien
MNTPTKEQQVTIAQWLRLLHEPGEVFEIRIPEAMVNGKFNQTQYGYFDDPDKAAGAMLPYVGKNNIYQTLQPVNPALLGRACNKLKGAKKRDPQTSDGDATRYKWFPVDTDPVRPSGISASNEELKAALERARAIEAHLVGEWGWPEPVRGISGNGGHLLWSIDLPNEPGSIDLIQRVLQYLSSRFDDDKVKVDTTIFNPSRIWKVYGTEATKGDSIPGRPHRMAKITYTPDSFEIVTFDMLKVIAPPRAASNPAYTNGHYTNGRAYTAGEIRAALDRLGVEYNEKERQGRLIFSLDKCLASEAHTDGAAITLEGGKAGYKCHHNSCSAKDWQAVKPSLFPDRVKPDNATNKKNSTPSQAVQGHKPTHDELRDRWIEQAGLIVYGLGEFHRYGNGLWLAIEELLVRQEILGVIEAAKSEGIKPTDAILKSVVGLTRTKLAKGDALFNADPDYLVCGNGTLHIPSRTLGEHSPKLYATSGVSYDYDPRAEALAWLAFLADLAESIGQDVVSFLQEIAGYALTTDTSYEIALWLYGPPGSGKSTFLEGLKAMLGNRAGLLGLADVERNRFALDKLPGKTLVVSSEQPNDFIASTHILNALISGETLRVDRKYRDAIEITPRCKIAWAMNELPRVSDPNSGLFRRVKVVSFPAIPEAERDPGLKEAIKAEGAGILNWALDGLDRLRKRGHFEIPQAVRDATESFRQNNDIPARFVDDCCLIGNDNQGNPYRAQAGALYKAYRSWCNENGHQPQSSTSIADDWKRLGFEKRRPGGINHWFGVGLKAG